MATLANHPDFQPRASRPPLHYNSRANKISRSQRMLLDALPFTFLLGLGALLQYLWSFSISYIPLVLRSGRWVHLGPLSALFRVGAFTLPLILLVGPWIKPTLQSYKILRNPWMDASISEKVYPKIPGGEVNEEGILESPEFALLLIGARCNKPFGPFDKNFKQIGDDFAKMWVDLEADPNSGLLNANSYISTDRPLNNQLMTIGYFRSTADVHAFAHKKFHRDVWTNYFAIPEKDREGLEIWHELYTIKAGGSEGIYINSTAHGLGGFFTQVGADGDSEGQGDEKTEGVKGEAGEWISTLRSAKGRFSSSKGRMGMKV
ncbi:hypothetical protein BCR35DRAFT_306583 [Leucosporidium creatinivorum]|uniref:Uncharacterized protein n=1 Tax=Leucosporidium creatinivorum TaxID=106004 RepID=A0A1Y2ET90_9BASI|nr:hypothetical protein BCR35DRAFT_306583 [Leucosporidium creatinivorum]